MSATAGRQGVEELVGAYRAALVAAGMYAGHPVTSVARTWLARVGIEGWARLSLAEQRATPPKDRRVVGWLMVTGRLRPSADYLVVGRPYLGEVASRHHRTFHAALLATAAELGFDPRSARLQWSAVIKVAVLVGVAPDRLSKPDLDRGRDLLVAAIRRHHPDSHGVRALTTALFGAEATLFHAGVIDTPPRKQHPDKAALRQAQWAGVPARLAATMRGYLEQIRLSLRPATVTKADAVLREFACFLADHAPEVGCVADVRRAHIEAYKLQLAARPSARGGRLSSSASPTTSAACAPASNASPSGKAPTPQPGCWCSPATCRCATSRYRASSTTAPPPSCCRPPAPTPTHSCACALSSWPALGCARASSWT